MLLVSYRKDRKLRKTQYADQIRNAAVVLTAKLGRWRDLAHGLFEEIQPVIISATPGVPLILQLTTSYVSSTPTRETLPVEQALPPLATEGYVDHDGARIWYGTAGEGEPVILLHGGMESSLSWGNQVPALIKTNHEVILIDSRGHGRSTLGPYPLSYERMQSDVLAVMDALHLKKASFLGWSDGANISLIMAMKNPERVNGVYAFGANMKTDAIVPGTFSSHILSEVAARLAKDYARMSPTPTASIFFTKHSKRCRRNSLTTQRKNSLRSKCLRSPSLGAIMRNSLLALTQTILHPPFPAQS